MCLQKKKKVQKGKICGPEMMLRSRGNGEKGGHQPVIQSKEDRGAVTLWHMSSSEQQNLKP